MPKKILLIDDDPLVIKSIDRYLKSRGYDIETAQSGKEALEKTKSLDFDLIISDVRMPGMDGIETLKRIREFSLQHNKDKVPAIIITGYAGGDEIYKKAGELGIAECIYKPFELDEFIEAIRKTLEITPKYKRTHPRVEIAFPVEVEIKDMLANKIKHITGKTVDLSENGIGLILDFQLALFSKVAINVTSSPRYAPFKLEAVVIWSKPVFKDGYFRCGLHSLKIEDQHLNILKEILSDYKLLDNEFISLTEEFKQFIQEVKDSFDEFDKVNTDEQKQIDFIEASKKEIFEKLDIHFYKIWDIAKGFERDRYIIHQNYYQHALHPLFEEPIEINRHIYRKPLGYPGDYIIMNYIYEYHVNNYLGRSSYERLINNYTCNIPISCSNIKRKDFLKDRIVETMKMVERPKILSVACGPARELTELLREGKINKPLIFKCLDFEKRALDYIDNQIRRIEPGKKQMLSIEYISRDIASIIRDKKLKEEFKNCDLIYAFGIFDYLGDRMASRLTRELFQLLRKEGKLIICNAELKNSSHRAYYELLGEWNMVHRTTEEMLEWTRDINKEAEIKFTQPYGFLNYLFLIIKKL